MKNLLSEIKWLAKQIKPFTLSLISIITFETLLSLFGVSMAVASKNLIDAASAGKGSRAVQSGIIFSVLIFTQIGLQALDSVISTRTMETISNSMRQKLFTRLSQTTWTDFSKYHSEDILTRMTSDVYSISNGLVNILPGFISLGVRVVAAFATLLYFEPLLAVLAFILGPISVFLSRFFTRRLKQLHIKIQEAESSYRAFMHESIQNMLIVKTFRLENRSINRISDLQDERLDLVLQRNRLGVTSNFILSFSYWLGYILAFGWGAFRLSAGAASFGTLTAFLQLSGQVQGPFIGLARSLPQIVSATASSSRLMEFDMLSLDQSEYPVPCWPNAGILFENVSFAYEQDKAVLRNISFKILPGEIVVLAGPSGEGKTTLIRLLLSLLRPESGHIYFTNGPDGKFDACSSSRALISYVPQGNTLFSGSIADNLRIGNPNASLKDLEAAARTACAWEFIEELPEGLDTKIGERGLGISEGQAQRLAIARAFLLSTPVLILDEATSALDAQTEFKILQGIRKSGSLRTCIIITHRPAALEICDRVLKLKDGCILEQNGKFIANSANPAV